MAAADPDSGAAWECRAKQFGGRIFAMLRDRRILVYFSVIVLIVGYEVGLLTTIPKYLTERCAIPLDEGGPFAGSLYFAARTIGTFVGTIILAKVARGDSSL
ncbi:MAG: hypothetical protein ACLR8Y_04895 [Alistipes indistinctus]